MICELSSSASPLIGEAELESSQIIHWYISELADSEEETAELMFTVRHMSCLLYTSLLVSAQKSKPKAQQVLFMRAV